MVWLTHRVSSLFNGRSLERVDLIDVALIGRAKLSIDLASYALTDPSVLDALSDAHRRTSGFSEASWTLGALDPKLVTSAMSPTMRDFPVAGKSQTMTRSAKMMMFVAAAARCAGLLHLRRRSNSVIRPRWSKLETTDQLKTRSFQLL